MFKARGSLDLARWKRKEDIENEAYQLIPSRLSLSPSNLTPRADTEETAK